MKLRRYHRRTRSRGSGSSGIVVFIVVLALAAAGYWLYATGQIFGGGSPTSPGEPSAGPAGSGAGASQGRPGNRGDTMRGDGAAGETPDLGGTLFDMNAAGTPRPGGGSGPDPLARRAAERATAEQGRQAQVTAAEAAVASARVRLQAARRAAEPKAQTPGVKAARAKAEATEATVKRLRAAGAAGTSEMLAASKQNMAAKGNLRKALDSAVATNPSVLAVQAELKQAEAALRAARTSR